MERHGEELDVLREREREREREGGGGGGEEGEGEKEGKMKSEDKKSKEVCKNAKSKKGSRREENYPSNLHKKVIYFP